MLVSLTSVTLAFGLATASLQGNNTTSTGVNTVVPFIPVVANSESHLETPHPEDVPTTYASTGTSSSVTDHGTTGSITSYKPTYGPSISPTSSTRSSGRIVHTEQSNASLYTPTTSSPPPTLYPSPAALTKYTTVAHPTLPVSASPIALSSYPTVAPPTLPVSQQGPTTYIPAIVHTEIPGESLDVPPSQTYANPGHEPTKPVAPVPGGDGVPSPSTVPSEAVTVPTTLVTTVPEQVTTMGGGETMTIPATISTMEVLPVSMSSSTTMQTSTSAATSETAPSGGADGSMSGSDQEGAASSFSIGMWSCTSVGMALGCVLLM